MNELFWALYAAHLVADYPLQTDWVFQAKRTWTGLWIHVAIHFVVTVIVMWPAVPQVWPYLVGLALVHYVVDGGKNVVGQLRPNWIMGPYLVDQFLHTLSLLGLAYLLNSNFPGLPLGLKMPWSIYLTGLVLATFVWFITERLMLENGSRYQAEVETQKWSRIATRALLLVLFVWIGQLLFGLPGQEAQAAPLRLAAGLLVPYVSSTFGRRALITDIVVSTVVAALVLLVQLS